MIRLRLGGEGFAGFRPNEFTDSYVKLHFAAPGEAPVTRTYTVRRVDESASWLEIDFVIHGDEGLAAQWALRARAGEQIRVAGPGGAYRPDPSADWYLFAGDASALPAIAAALESLPASAVGVALLEVESREDEIELEAPAGVELRWLHHQHLAADGSSRLVDAIEAIAWLPGRVEVFAHGEREQMKALRNVLFVGRGLERSQVSLSGYWAQGRSEDVFQAEKRQPIGKI